MVVIAAGWGLMALALLSARAPAWARRAMGRLLGAATPAPGEKTAPAAVGPGPSPDRGDGQTGWGRADWLVMAGAAALVAFAASPGSPAMAGAPIRLDVNATPDWGRLESQSHHAARSTTEAPPFWLVADDPVRLDLTRMGLDQPAADEGLAAWLLASPGPHDLFT